MRETNINDQLKILREQTKALFDDGRVKWGKVSHLFSWLRGGETMKIEPFFNID